MKKIILVGQSAGGKDFMFAGLVKLGLKPCLKTTTRPIRSNEIDGITYRYITNESFINIKNDMIVQQTFDLSTETEEKIWYYGLEYDEFTKGEVCIMTPLEVNMLSEKVRSESNIIYINIDEDIRRERLLSREDNNDSIERRIKSDFIDFKDFTNYDSIITDPMFSVEEVFKALYK